MSKYKEHHPFCNYFTKPIEDCPFCDNYWETYPINEGESNDEMVKRYFPDAIAKNTDELTEKSNFMEAYYLITYYYVNGKSYHYEITSDVEAWIAKSQSYYPDVYVLINVLPISKKFAREWDGNLHTM